MTEQAAQLNDPAKNAFAVVSRQLTQLARLVDDLLDVTRITTGNLTLTREPGSLDAIINAAVESVSPLIEAARHAPEVVTPDDPLWAEVDSDRVSQVISNLLTNASKYTPRGGKIGLNVSRDVNHAVIRDRTEHSASPCRAFTRQEVRTV